MRRVALRFADGGHFDFTRLMRRCFVALRCVVHERFVVVARAVRHCVVALRCASRGEYSTRGHRGVVRAIRRLAFLSRPGPALLACVLLAACAAPPAPRERPPRPTPAPGVQDAPLLSFPGFAGAPLPPGADWPIDAVVGVLLPLSGDFAPFGEEALRGMVLASALFDAPSASDGAPSPDAASANAPGSGRRPASVNAPSGSAGSGGSGGPGAAPGVGPVDSAGPSAPPPGALRLRIEDTRGNAGAARAAARRLAADPDVQVWVGGMLPDAAEAVAAVAEEAGVPLLTLTRREEVSRGRRGVLRIAETPALEAARMAAYATGPLGLQRFAILYPDHPYGLHLRKTFWDAVEAGGGEVVGVARYPADATDFSGPIRRLIGYELLSEESREALAERERLRKRAKRLPAQAAAELRAQAGALQGEAGAPLPPFVDFEALFVPGAGGTVGLIAPHLTFHEVRGVRLLGSGAWNAPELLALGGRHLNGAVFPAGSFAASRAPRQAAFSMLYREHYAEAPGDTAAAAYDAVNLALLALARGAAGRRALLAELRAIRSFEGVSGRFAWSEDARWLRESLLLGVDHGILVEVAEDGEPPYLYIPPPDCPPEGEDELPADAGAAEDGDFVAGEDADFVAEAGGVAGSGGAVAGAASPGVDVTVAAAGAAPPGAAVTGAAPATGGDIQELLQQAEDRCIPVLSAEDADVETGVEAGAEAGAGSGAEFQEDEEAP